MYSVGHNVNDTVPILWIVRILSPPSMSHDTRSALEPVSRELQRRLPLHPSSWLPQPPHQPHRHRQLCVTRMVTKIIQLTQ